MATYASNAWYPIRGTILAVLGLTAAYALSLLLDAAGAGFGWQAGLGLAAFTTTVLTVGRYGFRMHPHDTVEETATALRVIGVALGLLALTSISFFLVLLRIDPAHA